MTYATRQEPSFRLNISGAFVRRTVLDNANLANADLSFADASNASFRGANFEGTKLNGTVLKGADLRGAENLTEEQIQSAIIDCETKLPIYLSHLRPHS